MTQEIKEVLKAQHDQALHQQRLFIMYHDKRFYVYYHMYMKAYYDILNLLNGITQ